MSKAWNIIWRLLGFPFVIGIILVAAVRDTFVLSYRWLRYGGEMIMHRSDSKAISQVYELVERHIKSMQS